jgi:hypothetical protein
VYGVSGQPSILEAAGFSKNILLSISLYGVPTYNSNQLSTQSRPWKPQISVFFLKIKVF